jgi:hypothetical protein
MEAISVKDELPPKNRWVLTYPNPYGSSNQFNYPDWTLAYLNVNSVWVSSAHSKRWKDPTHWMPIPPPPSPAENTQNV